MPPMANSISIAKWVRNSIFGQQANTLVPERATTPNEKNKIKPNSYANLDQAKTILVSLVLETVNRDDYCPRMLEEPRFIGLLTDTSPSPSITS